MSAGDTRARREKIVRAGEVRRRTEGTVDELRNEAGERGGGDRVRDEVGHGRKCRERHREAVECLEADAEHEQTRHELMPHAR